MNINLSPIVLYLKIHEEFYIFPVILVEGLISTLSENRSHVNTFIKWLKVDNIDQLPTYNLTDKKDQSWKKFIFYKENIGWGGFKVFPWQFLEWYSHIFAKHIMIVCFDFRKCTDLFKHQNRKILEITNIILCTSLISL